MTENEKKKRTQKKKTQKREHTEEDKERKHTLRIKQKRHAWNGKLKSLFCVCVCVLCFLLEDSFSQVELVFCSINSLSLSPI